MKKILIIENEFLNCNQINYLVPDDFKLDTANFKDVNLNNDFHLRRDIIVGDYKSKELIENISSRWSDQNKLLTILISNNSEPSETNPGIKYLSPTLCKNSNTFFNSVRDIYLSFLKENDFKFIKNMPLIGISSEIDRIKYLITKFSKSPFPVLITGETGTGKSLIANLIYQNSHVSGPFVDLNCASIHESLIQSELNGHIKGSFTGAINDKIGLIESADKGTLFLDELSCLSRQAQASLLKTLENKKIKKVGSNIYKSVTFRLICGTNSHISELIKEGSFREDLFFRLNTLKLEIAPLRNRKADIPLLAEYFLIKDRYNNKKELSYEACEKLQNYSWPGNIRELRNIIDRSITFSEGSVIRKKDIIFD